jgi:hypothetical protein
MFLDFAFIMKPCICCRSGLKCSCCWPCSHEELPEWNAGMQVWY